MAQLIKNNLYYIVKLDDEMYYKNIFNLAVFEDINYYIKYVNNNNYIIENEYIIDNIKYKCKDVDLFYGFVYGYEDLFCDRVAYYTKNINDIKPLGTYENTDKLLNINNIILSNSKKINNITKKHLCIIPKISNLCEFQNAIQIDLFVNKYILTSSNKIVINNNNDNDINHFNYYCSLLPKATTNFYVFRKQRFTSTYNPYIQFNSMNEEKYLLPFSTSSSYDFVYKWNGVNNGIILVINVPYNSNYMVLYDQTQYEITLTKGILKYIYKGFYNNQPIIICNFIQSN
jgi:hypothetical protein